MHVENSSLKITKRKDILKVRKKVYNKVGMVIKIKRD